MTSLRYLFLFDGDYFLAMSLWLVAGAIVLWVLLKLRREASRPSRSTTSHRSGDDRARQNKKLRKSIAKPTSPRLRWIHLALSVWMLLAALTVPELYFALFYNTTDSFNMTNVSKKWYTMYAETQKRPLEITDGEGFLFRDDHDFPKSVGSERRRICFLGDSFTFGHGIRDISDRFSNRVGAALEERHPGRFVVSNLANAGVELHWIEMQLRELFKAGFKIDAIVYVVCLNDIETFHPSFQTYYDGFSRRVGQPQFFLFRDTYFFNLLYYRFRQMQVPELRDYYSFVKEYYEAEPWKRMQQKLDDVHQTCQENGADLRIVVFPFLHNLGPEYPFGGVHKQFAEYCSDRGVPMLDLEGVLAPHVPEGLTVNRLDAHPNERAHQLVATAIERQLLADYFEPRE